MDENTVRQKGADPELPPKYQLLNEFYFQNIYFLS